MPYKADKLPEQVIARIADWINAGAPFDQLSLSDVSAVNQSEGQAVGNSVSKLFVEQVRPVLETQCLDCHGGKFKQAGLNISTRELLLRGSDNGVVIVPGNAQDSLLVKKIKHEHEPAMPYKRKKLSEKVIAQIVEWINAGAPYDEPLKMSTSVEQVISQENGSDHWAFKAPIRAALPVVKNRAWVLNPIDTFIASEHEKRGLKPLPPADKRVLLRRVYLDLIGLPPTPEEIRAFLSDHSLNAYEKVVNKLLASPRYGERWGRHWMDIWRYSDWYGSRETDELFNSQRHIWRWRDWIIESLNQDKGYDRMIMEMLAGDEIAPNDPQVLRATGYLGRNWHISSRNVWLQDTVEHTAAGFLGITLKCARCHDHKYDPIAQEEYYNFRAFFEPYDVRIDRVPGQPDWTKDGLSRVFDSEPREATTAAPLLPAIYRETYRFIRGDEKDPDRSKPLSPGVPEVLGNHEIKIHPLPLPLEAYNPDLRPFVHQDLIAQAKTEIERAKAALAKANQTLAKAQQRVAELPFLKKELIRTSQTGEDPSDVSARTNSSASLSESFLSLRPFLLGMAAKKQLVSPALPRGENRGEGTVTFEEGIQPLLEKHCLLCHNSQTPKSELALDSLDAILEGGALNGPAVIARKSRQSPLILYLRGDKKPRMPLGGTPLPEEQIALIEKWIDQLPEEDPRLTLDRAEAARALAEKQLALAEANLPALEARIAADKAQYADSPDPQAQRLAKLAQKAERQANILKAETNLLRAQQRLIQAESKSKPQDERAKQKNVEAARKQLEAAVATLAQSVETYTPIAKPYPNTSTGRRSALAGWIASKQNPLTARVAINHMWLRHFGKPLVPTVANFGKNGRPPTHPELLDWLASELMEKNWSMKAMHRLMVTSSTYRMQSSAGDPKHFNISVDPENRYLWRMNPRRMEAEVVRDTVLYLAGQLETAMGGPELEESIGEESRRRSVYYRHTPESQMVFLKIFDEAEATECYARKESIVPQQALALANSKLTLTQARLLARHISDQIGSNAGKAEFVVAAFEIVLGQLPSTQERAASEKFLSEQAELFRDAKKLTPFRSGSGGEIPPAADPHLRARENLVQALLGHNEFVTIR